MRFIILVALLLLPRLANAEVAVRSTLLHGGQERIHYFFKPKQVVEPPLIVVLHGMGGNAKNLRFGIGMTDRAALAGMSVVFPQGVRLPGGARHWNAGFRFSNTDDVGYLTTLIRKLQDEHGVSRENVFILGLSMGGYMAYHMACRTEIPIRAIASVTGTMGGATWANCPAPAKPSILHLHGR
ncbi:MAG: PHB depolymerase family esterase, partial [Pseudomonadota bacterium]